MGLSGVTSFQVRFHIAGAILACEGRMSGVKGGEWKEGHQKETGKVGLAREASFL